MSYRFWPEAATQEIWATLTATDPKRPPVPTYSRIKINRLGLDVNTEKLNAWLTLAANISVIAGIIFLAVEIRQNTSVTRLNTAQNLSGDLRQTLAYIHADDEFARIYLTGQRDIDELTPHERFRFYTFLAGYLRALENAYYQLNKGAVDPYMWEAVRGNLMLSKGTSGFLAFWRDRQQIFSPEFRAFYNDLPANDPGTASDPYVDRSQE